jgi:hypothetical protein
VCNGRTTTSAATDRTSDPCKVSPNIEKHTVAPRRVFLGPRVRPVGENAVTSQWQYQVRFEVNDSDTAESIRRNLRDPALVPLFDILANHRAAPKCQFDAFAEYVAAAEEYGVESYALYQWTKATIEDSAKKDKYLKSFTLYVDDREIYAKEVADALEADLQPLVTSGVIKRVSKYDTNPANNPQPPQRLRERG